MSFSATLLGVRSTEPPWDDGLLQGPKGAWAWPAAEGSPAPQEESTVNA